MRDRTAALSIGATIFALIALSGQALANGAPPVPAAPARLTPMSNEGLDSVSAGQSPAAIALTNQNLTAINSGNSITAKTVRTGPVTFSSGALQGFNGIGNFVVNTGNNNNIQGSLSVTVIPLP